MKTIIYYTDKKPERVNETDIFFQYSPTWDHPSGGYGNLDNIKNLKPHKIKHRFYHSYWSKPAITANRWQIRNQHYLSLVYTAISVYCLKALGQEIVLHTDKDGAELLSCLPYDEIYIDLEDNKCPINFWASGKFVSVRNGEPGIHIDTDLFITNPKVIDILDKNEIVVTHSEETKAYKDTIKMYLDLFTHFNIVHPFYGDNSQSINCGIIKLPENIKKIYINYYFKFVNDFNNNQYLKDASSIEKQSLYAPDLVIEQLLLKKLLDVKQVKPCIVLRKIKDKREEQHDICHLLSFEKYILIPHMIAWLKKHAPDYWERVSNKLKELKFTIQVNLD
jgi:hypothetical protein